MLFSVLSRKCKVPRHNFSPLRSRSWLKDLHWWLPQGQVPRPCPAVTLWGSRVSRTQLAFRLLRPPKWRLLLLLGHGTGIGERFSAASRPGPRPVGDPGEQVSWRAPRGQDLSLISLSTWRPPLRQPLAECLTNGRSLTVGSLWAGPTAVPTSDWAGPLKVAPWPSVACGRGPLQHWPMTEQDPLSRNTVQSSGTQQTALCWGLPFTALRYKVRWRVPRKKAGIRLLPNSLPDDHQLGERAHWQPLIDSWLLVGGPHCSINQRLSRTTNGPRVVRDASQWGAG